MSDNKKQNSLENLLEESLKNVREDRKNAHSLLEDVSEHIGKQGADRHRESGTVAAKYLEVLQKSNEQLVKIMDMIRKGRETEFGDLEEDDKEDIYSELESEGVADVYDEEEEESG